MESKMKDLESEILLNKQKYDEDNHNVKDYMDSLNNLADFYINEENWEKSDEILSTCMNLFPNAYRVLSTGLYRRVGIVCSINYYIVSKKMGKTNNLVFFNKIKDFITAAEEEDISTSHDKRTSEEANILNRIEIYKKIYKTNNSSSEIEREKEKVFKEFYWSDYYENHKFSWE